MNAPRLEVPSPTGATSSAESLAESPAEGRAAWWLRLARIAGCAAIARAQLPYRGFPAIDDFAYLPLANATLDSTLFTRDSIVSATPLHVPLLPAILWFLRNTIGEAAGFWCLTWLLTGLTIAGLARCQRALGLDGWTLPLVVCVACLGRVDGLGRGDYDGLCGASFHSQWAALCCLLWCYAELIAGRLRRAGAFALATLAIHPVVGAHGIVTGAFGVCAWFPASCWARGLAAAMAVFWGIAASVFVAWLAFRPLAAPSIDDLDLATRAALFRLPQEFEFERMKSWLFLFIATLGWWSGVRWQRSGSAAARVWLALFSAQLFLLAAGAALYEAQWIGWWSRWTFIPFQLSLTRTTPLLLALGALALARPLELWGRSSTWRLPLPEGVSGLVSTFVATLAAGLVGLFQLTWNLASAAALAMLAASVPSRFERRAVPWRAAGWTAVGVAALAWCASRDAWRASFPPEQVALADWVATATSVDALFIIPPSFEEFRTLTKRSAYVDFKTVTLGRRPVARDWLERLIQVAHPDALAWSARGWEGIVEWDRTYANRNSPARIADLLQATGADYFVWDRQGLRAPPFVERDETPDARIESIYANERYIVWKRTGELAHELERQQERQP